MASSAGVGEGKRGWITYISLPENKIVELFSTLTILTLAGQVASAVAG